MSESERLDLVADEYARALGRDNDELNSQRTLALQYFKGEMPDMQVLPGRSKVTSSDIADAIETVLPDVIEIFMGEDVATFTPREESDEKPAQQETDYVNHVFHNENPGFLNLYTAMKDALLVKTGIFKWWGEEYEEEAEEFEGKTGDETASAFQKYPDRLEITRGDITNPNDTFDFTIKGVKKWRACVAAVPPEDFGVSKDTVNLRDAPYCFHRTRLRAYELKKRGISADLVDDLPSYGQVDNGVAQARSLTQDQVDDKGGPGEQRIVEVIEHYLNGPDGRWQVLTSADCGKLLDEQKHPKVPFAALTPYLIPHQFFGESVADKLMEIQKIMTALKRMVLDSGWFALNQRMSVNMQKSNEWTISDLLNNAPNVPVRTNGDQAVMPLTSAGLPFDGFGALEYFATQAESRTGIVRNSQGLNPDTLHDTAKGALALLSAAQRRTRMIARIFAETGIKDVFLGLHDLLRQNATGPAKVRLRGEWQEVDPTAWGSRSDMTIEVGIGAGGKEAQTIALQQALAVQEAIVGAGDQGLVTPQNVYNLVKKYFERGLGLKSADPFLSDPSKAEPREPAPDPAMMEAQAKLQLEQAKAQGQQQLAEQKTIADLQLQQAKAEADITLQREKAAAQIEADRERHMLEMEQSRERFAVEMAHKRELASAELQLKQEEMAMEFELKREANRMNAEARSESIDGPSQGGEPG